jgi:hypothetical protein
MGPEVTMEGKDWIARRLHREAPSYDEYFAAPALRGVPAALRRFFVEQGAAELQGNVLRVGQFETEIERIFGISDDEHYDLARQVERYAGRLPRGHLPLAELVMGDLLTVDVASSRVHLWVHDQHDEYQLRRRRRPLPVVVEHCDQLLEASRPPRWSSAIPTRSPGPSRGFWSSSGRQGLLVADRPRGSGPEGDR